MKVDRHTPCPACPIHVRSVYAAAAVVVGRLLGDERATIGDALESVQALQIAVRAMQPFVDAHQGNQLHALSNELVDARAPHLPQESIGG